MPTSYSKLPNQLVEQMKSKNIWQPSCPVALRRLALVNIRYRDFENKTHDDGELVVMDAVAPRVARIFETLYERNFPIEKICSLHHYDGDDERSMADNNSSAFNFRAIAGSTTVSIHGYGLAIDVNPLQNPYLTIQESEGIAKIHPAEGWSFLNRSNQKPGMVEPMVQVFADNGFTIWGGRWTTPIDYHHFQTPRVVAELLCALEGNEGTEFFEQFADRKLQLPETPNSEETARLVAYCNEDRKGFFKMIGMQLS